MNTIENILSRRSIRKYTDSKISEEDIHTILQCGMSGPSAVNARDWSFVVVDDPAELKKLAEAAGRAGNIIGGSAMSVLVCVDGERTFKRAPEFGFINGSIAAQNMILAAHDLGIGSVWLGVWPQEEKMTAQREHFGLPENVIPHSIIAFGYPDEDRSGLPHLDYEEDRVHRNKW